MEQTTLAVNRVPVQNFLMAVPERLAPVAGPLVLNRFTREGLDSLSYGLGERFFVDASQHPSTKLFPVWKTFSSRFKKVSTRNASAKRLSSALRVNAAELVHSENSVQADHADGCGSKNEITNSGFSASTYVSGG
jgi:hypothetical protein